MTPVLGPNSPAQVRYNKAHILTRNTVERSYGILKRRFPCLSLGMSCHVDNVSAIIVACCVLHNIALNLGDEEPPIDLEMVKLLKQLQIPENQEIVTGRSPAGFAKRNVLISNYFH
ncbi:putative nuclease HARBI1 [Parasteatoda tepidariorum]|uniref:putative nuclease HARBI1 n=1 Tax=Parasteatoda tepidariorum TaxID=114398 RepID=UPI0039BCD815